MWYRGRRYFLVEEWSAEAVFLECRRSRYECVRGRARAALLGKRRLLLCLCKSGFGGFGGFLGSKSVSPLLSQDAIH